jgi:ATP-dependent Lon protease
VGLYRIEVNEGPGGGVRILNQSPPSPFRESVRIAEQNLYARARELVGDRNPREHEFAVQLRSFDSAKTAGQTGVAVIVALASALLARPLRGGMAVVGGINLGGSIEQVHNAVDVVEHALSKGAATVSAAVHLWTCLMTWRRRCSCSTTLTRPMHCERRKVRKGRA